MVAITKALAPPFLIPVGGLVPKRWRKLSPETGDKVIAALTLLFPWRMKGIWGNAEAKTRRRFCHQNKSIKNMMAIVK
jgi:hypothetical protein